MTRRIVYSFLFLSSGYCTPWVQEGDNTNDPSENDSNNNDSDNVTVTAADSIIGRTDYYDDGIYGESDEDAENIANNIEAGVVEINGHHHYDDDHDYGENNEDTVTITVVIIQVGEGRL